MQPLKKRGYWNVRGVRANLSLVLALVYVASQSLTLSHNAEFGPGHIHDHEHHDHQDHHETDVPVFITVFNTPFEEPDSKSGDELCAFVLHSDRCGVADVPYISAALTLEFFNLDYRSTHAGFVSRSQTSHDQARAPPRLA